jgi:outer membrane protein OmpA-like peptidoglycan-associated protein
MKIRLLVLTTLAGALTACSSMPDRNLALDAARRDFTIAQSDSGIARLAPDELSRAGQSLSLAERAHAHGDHPEIVTHLAYMTAQHVVIAGETASSRAAQSVTMAAAAERDRMRLAQRTDEVLATRQQLAVSQQDSRRSDARVEELESQLKALDARQTERGMVITLGDLLFANGQSRLQPGGAHNLARLAEFLRRNPRQHASIEGHTDSVGNASANLELSQRRAMAVMTELINLGVPSDRLSTRAFGQDAPVASNRTAAGRQMNRRVEIVFAPPSEEVSTK